MKIKIRKLTEKKFLQRDKTRMRDYLWLLKAEAYWEPCQTSKM